MRDINKAIACFRELGFKPNVDNFENRLKMQKIICLLELMGIDCGFKFSLYVRGAYSRELTELLYSKKQIVEGLKTESACAKRTSVEVRTSTNQLSKEEISKIEEFRGAMHDMKASLLEIAATYAFIASTLGLDNKEATIKLKEMKPFYSEGEIAVGISRAKLLLFKPTEKDLDSLKEEMKPWEAAADEDARKWA
ncbi:hypothetical protein COV61_05215 [Candidatus Micrarchaeota archaeon CG11_big_fil_rev_8_21_14_0_20_47_5]|nr:MAG: hypothetical protein AUJ17_02390 [Candidatus Micrarchaeota archaeon CG1_02_47_40]PIN82695.1 MAG: hypothetical protein COV61_05215 [Candidatus Micrarchaeota archaeon CG11_big_fil_rev_8_21_14_0_20_47_5]